MGKIKVNPSLHDTLQLLLDTWVNYGDETRVKSIGGFLIALNEDFDLDIGKVINVYQGKYEKEK